MPRVAPRVATSRSAPVAPVLLLLLPVAVPVAAAAAVAVAPAFLLLLPIAVALAAPVAAPAALAAGLPVAVAVAASAARAAAVILAPFARSAVFRRARRGRAPAAADVPHRRAFDFEGAPPVAGAESLVHASVATTARRPSTRVVRCVSVLRGAALRAELLEVAPQPVHALREVHAHAAVVDEHVVHLQVRRLRRLARLERDEREAQRVARLVIAHDVARHDAPEPREDDLQVLVPGDRVEFADEQ